MLIINVDKLKKNLPIISVIAFFIGLTTIFLSEMQFQITNNSEYIIVHILIVSCVIFCRIATVPFFILSLLSLVYLISFLINFVISKFLSAKIAHIITVLIFCILFFSSLVFLRDLLFETSNIAYVIERNVSWKAILGEKFSPNERDMAIERYAGCQIRAMIDQKTDEEFSKMWTKDAEELHFDYNDVVYFMLNNCPPNNEDKIKEEREISRYQHRFINQEFSVLKNNN